MLFQDLRGIIRFSSNLYQYSDRRNQPTHQNGLFKLLSTDAGTITVDHLLGDPEKVERTILYTKCLTNILHHPAKFPTNEYTQRRLIFGLIILSLCSFSFLVKTFGGQSKVAVTLEDAVVTSVPATQATTSPSMLSLSTTSVEPKTHI